jgi:hypothetical protein
MRKQNKMPQESESRHSGKDYVKPLSRRELTVKLDDSAQKIALDRRKKATYQK